MRKSKKKVLGFAIALAFISYDLAIVGFFATPKAFAYESTETEGHAVNCEQFTQDCEQEHTDDCRSCETHNQCHSASISIPLSEGSFIENGNSFSTTASNMLKKLDYPPETRPA